MKLTFASSTRPHRSETANGDAVVARVEPDGALFSVVDALGHGASAAEVAQAATRYLQAAPLATGLRPIVEGLHTALSGTRGAAAMVCLLARGRLQGCGVGNVELRSTHGALPIVLSPGVLGARVRVFRVFEGPVAAGERLLLFSDGLSSRLELADVRSLTPTEACRRLVDTHGRPHDDSTALVIDIEA